MHVEREIGMPIPERHLVDRAVEGEAHVFPGLEGALQAFRLGVSQAELRRAAAARGAADHHHRKPPPPAVPPPPPAICWRAWACCPSCCPNWPMLCGAPPPSWRCMPPRPPP